VGGRRKKNCHPREAAGVRWAKSISFRGRKEKCRSSFYTERASIYHSKTKGGPTYFRLGAETFNRRKGGKGGSGLKCDKPIQIGNAEYLFVLRTTLILPKKRTKKHIAPKITPKPPSLSENIEGWCPSRHWCVRDWLKRALNG